MGGHRDLVRGGGGRRRRAAREGGQEAGARGALPCVRQALRRARHARAHLAPPGHLAVPHLRALRGAARRLPRARGQDRAHALGGAAELALHGALRGAGARRLHAGLHRQGSGGVARRGRPQALGHAGAGRLAGQGRGGLLRRDPRGHRRDQPRQGPDLHIHHARPRRQALRRRRRRQRQGRGRAHVRPARGPRRGPLRGRGGHPRHERVVLRGGGGADAAGGADDRPLPRDAAVRAGHGQGGTSPRGRRRRAGPSTRASRTSGRRAPAR